MANAEAMCLSNRAVWGDRLFSSIHNYFTAGQGLTLEQRENNMAKYQQTQIHYSVEKVENGFVVAIGSMNNGYGERFVFNTSKDLNQFLASKNLEVFEKWLSSSAKATLEYRECP